MNSDLLCLDPTLRYHTILVPMKPLTASVLLKKMDGSVCTMQVSSSLCIQTNNFILHYSLSLVFAQVDLNLVRHLVIDVSCIDKNLDMRLMLSAKRKITDLTVS